MAELGHPIPVPKLSSSVGMFDICCVMHTTGENDRQFDPVFQGKWTCKHFGP